jgi:hypothetical protein
MRRAALLALMLAALAAQPAAAQSIVGKWAIGGKCATPLSVIVIGPMEFGGEDFYCDFSSVKRTGNTVHWRGRCNFSENGYEPTQVIARLSGDKLRYRFVGRGWNGPFVRCKGG